MLLPGKTYEQVIAEKAAYEKKFGAQNAAFAAGEKQRAEELKASIATNKYAIAAAKNHQKRTEFDDLNDQQMMDTGYGLYD